MNKNWEERWTEDIDYLKKSLITKHKNLFFNVDQKEFEKKVLELKLSVNNLDYDEMKVELSRLVAMVKDAHTSIYFPVERYMPLRFYCFSDGIYITAVSKGYENLLYKKVTAIEDLLIEDVTRELAKIISHENKYFLKAQCVKYLQAADVLYGLLICDDKNKIKITVENEIIEVETVKLNELNYIDNMNVPIYGEKSKENYWFKYIDKDKSLYIKYNSCRENGIPLKDKIRSTINYIEKNNISKVTIDLRNNLGGDSLLLKPLIEYLKNNKDISEKGNLNVIIGRETFSSGLLNAYELKNQCNAILIGEPTGGKPNCYGEILRFNLPNSKFNVSYSTRYYKLIEDDSVDALYPDKIIEENIDDFRN
ncbi:peptidase S41 [Clostridium gelidum]|uniref:Peptidase S41 n=1 Tax=Clostridium gelidum TaxID=704125 RepID=A0ABN6IW24_9CLOT|nr:S41 family peptidase [Clostridium gelidum]BCZ46227.1 peptidase S41 [Clostridium gelidum]